MEHKQYAAALRKAAAGAAVALAALRVTHLLTAFDEKGLLPRGSTALLVTVLASAAFFAGFWFLASRLNRLPGTETCFAEGPVWLLLKLVAAGLLLLGTVFTLLGGETADDKAARIAALAGAAAALLMVLTALSRKRGPAFFWARLPLALFTGAALVLRFRTWSHDPLVIHIVPVLLAWTCSMVEMMLLTGFPLKAGHRRSAVLFGLAAGCFACMAVPDYVLGLRTELPELLILLGLALWGVTAALELLRDEVQTEQPPEPVPEPAEPVPEPASESAPEPAPEAPEWQA